MKLRCENCGSDIDWTREDLLYALDRLDRGEHAACACDDDCAAACDPWDRDILIAALEMGRSL
jgi:hypothetical protein